MAHTIYDMLAQATGKDLHRGPLKHTKVYALPGELHPYLLRMERNINPLHALRRHSSLTPMDYHITRQFGQPLLESFKGYQIVRRKQGITLSDAISERTRFHQRHLKTSPKDTAGLRARKDVMRSLSLLPDTAFDRLMGDVRYLSDHGITADLDLGNIVLTPQGNLQLIDINAGDRGENTRWAISMGLIVDLFVTSPDAEYHQLRRQLSGKMNAAARRADIPAGRQKALAYRQERNILFKEPIAIDEMARIPLSATPHELRLKLQEVENYLALSENGNGHTR